MDKLLFSHSYFMRFDPKQWATGQPYPPLATIGAAALLRERGFEVSLFDTMFVEDPEEVSPHLELRRSDFFVVYDDGFNYLTKMCLTNMREAAFRMIRLAREWGCIVILSSSDSTDHYREYLEKGADFVLLGEGEQTLLELVEAIRAGGEDVAAIREGRVDVSDVRGLAWVENGMPFQTAGPPVMKNLASIPFPARDPVGFGNFLHPLDNLTAITSINHRTSPASPLY